MNCFPLSESSLRPTADCWKSAPSAKESFGQETAEAVRLRYQISLAPDLSRVLMRTMVLSANRFNGFQEPFSHAEVFGTSLQCRDLSKLTLCVTSDRLAARDMLLPSLVIDQPAARSENYLSSNRLSFRLTFQVARFFGAKQTYTRPEHPHS